MIRDEFILQNNKRSAKKNDGANRDLQHMIIRAMDFNTLEKEIEQLNRINTRANYTSRRRYYSLYNSIYENLLEMEKVGQITIETGSKGLGYLHELLMNDGPEFSYTVVFWEKNNAARKYKIGVCIRGLPICKPMKD